LVGMHGVGCRVYRDRRRGWQRSAGEDSDSSSRGQQHSSIQRRRCTRGHDSRFPHRFFTGALLRAVVYTAVRVYITAAVYVALTGVHPCLLLHHTSSDNNGYVALRLSPLLPLSLRAVSLCRTAVVGTGLAGLPLPP